MVEATATLKLRRLVLAAAIAIAVQVPVTAAAWSRPAASCEAATGSHHVALVVQHLDGSRVVRCIPFAGASLTGEQALDLSGITYQTISYGGIGKAVCQVDGEPATFPPTCWTTTSPFWTLFVSRRGGTWTAASLGVSVLVLQDGNSEGLRYEPQAEPIAPTVYGNCPTAAPAPSPRATPTPRPVRTAEPTARPTARPTVPPGSPGALPSQASGAPAPGASALDGPAIALSGGAGSSPPPAAPQSTVASIDPSSGPSNSPLGLGFGLAVVAGLGGLAIFRARHGLARGRR